MLNCRKGLSNKKSAKEIIDESEVCLFYYNAEYKVASKTKSGTHLAYKYAQRKNKNIRIIEAHEIKLIQYLYSELKRLGAILYSPFPVQKFYSPVLSFNYKGLSSDVVGEALNKENIAVRTGLHCSPLAHKQIGTTQIGTVRVSPSIFNNLDEIDRLIFTLKNKI